MFTGESWRRRGWILTSAAAVVFFLHGASAWAVYLDSDQNVSFRGRIYSQWTLRTIDSNDTPNYTTQANPSYEAGQLVQQRNFYNPELDANLTKYAKYLDSVSWLQWLSPDDFGFRLAAWGFYDGVYDYGSSQYAAAASAPRVVPLGTPRTVISPGGFPPGYLPLPQQVIQSTKQPCTNPDGCVVGTLFSSSSNPATNAQAQQRIRNGETLEEIYDPTTARDVYGHQNRVNELYLNYSKGPLFVRLGRQSISWGESDTIGLLDANNPFDNTLGAAGFFEDLDEARIPLWTLRTSYELYRNLGPFSSGFIEAYIVPGAVDQHVALAPSPTGQSAYGPTGVDPHVQLQGNLVNQLGDQGNEIADSTSIVLVDKTPPHTMRRSRGGVRFQTIVGREHTVSGWWYRTYNQAPIARLVSVPQFSDFPNALAISTLERADIDVFGVADTFYLQPIDSILRLEAEYFLNEMSFLEWRPANGPNTAPQAIREMANIPSDGTTNYGKPVPRTNHLLWELGVDHNIFLRFLNPSNSILLASAFVGDYNLDATSNKRYGFGPGRPTKAFESFIQAHVQTDYMHGRLQPGITAIANYAGAFAVKATLDYRITDYLIAGIGYAGVTGKFHQIGFFRDYDQIWTRLTYQLN